MATHKINEHQMTYCSRIHINIAWQDMGRKFKFAVTGAAEDRAAIKFHDIGIWLKYSPNHMGKIKVTSPIPADAVALADVVAPLEVATTPHVEEEGANEDVSDSESDEEGVEDPQAA